jgi:hypothetical protein
VLEASSVRCLDIDQAHPHPFAVIEGPFAMGDPFRPPGVATVDACMHRPYRPPAPRARPFSWWMGYPRGQHSPFEKGADMAVESFTVPTP